MNSLLRALTASALLSVAVLFAPVWSAPQSTTMQLTVNQLAAKPETFVGKVNVVGRVAAVNPGKGFTLIDSVKCASCTTECLTDKTTKKIPFLWGGAAPEVKGIILVQGTLAKTAKGYTFTAEKVTKHDN